jgi:hypothetical protein
MLIEKYGNAKENKSSYTPSNRIVSLVVSKGTEYINVNGADISKKPNYFYKKTIEWFFENDVNVKLVGFFHTDKDDIEVEDEITITYMGNKQNLLRLKTKKNEIDKKIKTSERKLKNEL